MIAVPILLPLGAALAAAFLGRRAPRGTAVASTVALFLASAAALALSYEVLSSGREIAGSVPWIAVGPYRFDLALRVDRLTAVMLAVVLPISALIHLYATEYMKDDPSLGRFFALLPFFVAAMATLVLADNLLLLFVGWEGVGFASYALIGFWYRRPEPVRAGIKAFLFNRVGDTAFLIGIAILAVCFDTLSIPDLRSRIALESATGPFPLLDEAVRIGFFRLPFLTLLGLLFFVAASAKSAQFPLHLWLPDAMEGPTPVSALIHAATMVTAGIYLLLRLAFLYDSSIFLEDWIVAIGSITALGAAYAACAQRDLKRLLAYSTISHLGFMAAAVGAHAHGAALFHLATHAFFKALLFLGAGVLMHALHGEIDLYRMGGLAKRLPVTAACFVAGGLSIAGTPLTAGFFSKDLILEEILHRGHPFAFGMLLAAALGTGFYTMKAIWLAFFGPSRTPAATLAHLHRPGWAMEIPLVVLAGGALFAGWIPVPSLLDPREAHGGGFSVVTILALTSVLAGASISLHRYRRVFAPPEETWLARFLAGGYSLDRCVESTLVAPFAEFVDRFRRDLEARIRGASPAVGEGAEILAHETAAFQTGHISHHLTYLVIGAAFLLIWLGGGVG